MKNNPQFVRMTVRVPIEVHARLKSLSTMTGRSMQELAREAIQQYIAMESQITR
jgi:predicted DNA-binding protein